MEDENEKLRKKIQFLTDMIKNAKSQRAYSNQTQQAAFPGLTQATHSKHWKGSTGHRSSFHRGALHPGLTDSAFSNRQAAKGHITDSYHWGTSNCNDSSIIQNSSSSAIKSSKPAYQVSSKLKDNGKQIEHFKGADDIKAADTSDKASLKPSVSSHVIQSTVTAQFPSANSSKCSKHTNATASIQDANFNLKHQGQTEMKSQSSRATGNNLNKLKSTLTLGSSGDLTSKSDPESLQKEIEKMHNNISELRKLISGRKSTSAHEERKVQNYSRSGGITGHSVMVSSSPMKKVASESYSGLSRQSNNESGTKSFNLSKTDFNHTLSQGSLSRTMSQGSLDSALSHGVLSRTLSQGALNTTLSQGGLNRNLSESQGAAGTEKGTAAGLQKSRVQDLSVNVPKSSLTASSINNEDNMQPQSDLVSVSKYKLTRVSSSPTKLSSVMTDTCTSGRKAISSAFSKRGKASSHGNPISSSVKDQSVVSNVTSKTVSDTRTPAKFIKKSKYSITRVRNSVKKGLSKNKILRRHSNTSEKFVSFSKYAIKRVRRSLSDESKQISKDARSSLRGSGKNESAFPVSCPVQKAVTVVKSKFKMEKIPLHTFMIKNHYKLSHTAPYYKFDRNKFYRQRKYHVYKQRYGDTHPWNARYGFHGYAGYTKRGTYQSRYKGRGRNYRSYGGRYQKAFWHPSYNRSLALSQRYIQRRIQLLKEKIPFNPNHRLDRRMVAMDTKRPLNFVMINGMLYRSNAKTLQKAVTTKTSTSTSKVLHQTTIKKSATSNMKTVTVRGVKFEVDSHGRSLKRVHQLGDAEGKVADSSKYGPVSRIDIGGVTYMQTKPGTLERVGSVKTRMAATRVVNKTVQRAAAKYRKDNTKVKKKKTYCMFYNRFGKCNKKGNCPYIHDPEKVAVCTRFLRGTCKVKDCPFSHKVSKDKMPVCSYFLKGVCNRDDCPYLHVNVNRDAEICEDFLKGYCAHAEKCTRKHILKCPEFSKTGVCSKGGKCRLQHRKANKRKMLKSEEPIMENSKKPKLVPHSTDSTSSLLPSVDKSTNSSGKTEELCIQADTHGKKESENDANLPFRERKLPAYISLKTSIGDKKKDVIVIQEEKEAPIIVKPAMRIRPQL